MTALAADTARRERNPHLKRLASYPVAAATTIYAGSLVCLDGSGNAVCAADTASYVFAGIAESQVVNTTAAGFGTAGDLKVTVATGHSVRIAQTTSAFGATDAMATIACVLDDNTIDKAATTTNDVECGLIEEVESTTVAWLRVGVPGVNA